jgi:hypothetical protein
MDKAFESMDNFINESIKPETDFKSTVTGRSDISVYNHDYEDADGGELTVEWSLSIEAREWGVKNIGIVVKRVYGVLTFESYDEKSDETDTHDIDIDTNDDEWTINVEKPDDLSTIYVDDIEIDMKSKTIEVRF